MYIIASSKPWHIKECKSQNRFNTSEYIWVKSNDELDKALISQSDVRYIFFLHWNWLVPESILTQYECVCFHMTDVPYGRGGSPLQNLIVRGHTISQLTALRMVNEMDAGPVYMKLPLTLDGKAIDIYKRAGLLSYELIEWIISQEPAPEPQSGQVTKFKRRTPDQSKVPIQGSLSDFYDYIRMLDAPTYPYAFIEYGDYRLEFTDAHMEEDAVKASVKIRKVEKE